MKPACSENCAEHLQTGWIPVLPGQKGPIPVQPGGAFLFYLYTMKDNFSTQAEDYARYRPTYPPESFRFILEQVKERKTVWDCATGNGQTAKTLAGYFERVFATDISQKQLENACQAENVFYSLQPAEQTDFADDTFNLVTVSQALHWLQFDKFFAEAKRVVRPEGWIAVWVYSLPQISEKIDEIRRQKPTLLNP